MEDIKTNTNQTGQRDYDKDPIIIEDYNYVFIFMTNIILLSIILMWFILFYDDFTLQRLSKTILVATIMLIPYYQIYSNAKDKRKIVLKNKNITFYHENIVIESIDIAEGLEVKQTFSNIYDISQKPTKFLKYWCYLIFPLSFTIELCQLISKAIFHIYKDGYKSCRIYDAIIIFDKNKLINILPNTQKEYNEIKRYFNKVMNINMEHLDFYHQLACVNYKTNFSNKKFKDIPRLSEGE